MTVTDGQAAGTFTLPLGGSYTIGFSYSGDGTYEPATAAVPIVVEPGMSPQRRDGPHCCYGRRLDHVLVGVAHRPGACFVVTTLSAHRSDAWQPLWPVYNADALAINEWLHATFPHVIEWEQAVSDSIAAGSSILVDELHPNDAGIAVLASLARQAAATC